VSLSYLLNVINSVKSQEGRILIITTNHITRLDKALIRLGRINKKVKLGLANKKIIANKPIKGDVALLEDDALLKDA